MSTRSSDLKEHKNIQMDEIHGHQSENVSNESTNFSYKNEPYLKTINTVSCSYNICKMEEIIDIKEEIATDNEDSLDATELSKTEYMYDETTEYRTELLNNIDNDLPEKLFIVDKNTAENLKVLKLKHHFRKQLLIDNKCAVCNKVFNFQRDLIKHVQRFHCNGKAFKCCNCIKRFSKIQTLLTHSKIHRKLPKKNTKKHSYSMNKKKPIINRHQKPHENSIKHICKFCSKTFDLIGQMRNHLKLHTEQRPYSCHLCTKSYMHRQGLYRHLSLHTEDRSYACSLCEKSFKDKASMEKHQKMHIKPKYLKAYACTNCYKSFDTELSLNLHSKLHTGERPYSCHLCEKSYIRKKDLNKHKRKVHSEDKDLNQTASNNEPDYNKHITNLTNQEPDFLKNNNFSYCKENPTIVKPVMKANDTNNTDHHNNICKNIKTPLSDNESETGNSLKNKHFCKYCPRSFDQLGNLKCHLRSHSEERPFACSLCDKAYKHNSHLKQHQKIHLDANKLFKKHVCKICSKSFDLMGRLKNHLRTHSEERAFVCSFCEKSFKYKCDLNRHLKLLHSGENPYSCSLCNISYTDKRSFNKHQKTHLNKKSKNCYKISLQDETLDLKSITDIKEEIDSDSECHQDDMETKSVLEIFKTEYISEEDIINSAVRLEDNSQMLEDSKYK